MEPAENCRRQLGAPQTINLSTRLVIYGCEANNVNSELPQTVVKQSTEDVMIRSMHMNGHSLYALPLINANGGQDRLLWGFVPIVKQIQSSMWIQL